jgi:hypothetical protein
LNIPLFIYHWGVFVISILLTAGDQKVIRIRTYATPCISVSSERSDLELSGNKVVDGQPNVIDIGRNPKF